MSTEWDNVAAVAAKLNELSLVTTGPDEMFERLDQAVTIAKMGGVSDDALCALLHLAGTRSMTPTTERVLADAGIDTTPWAVLRGEQKMVAADAIVIERAELPEVTEDGEADGTSGKVARFQCDGTSGFADSPPWRHRQIGISHLALAEYLAAHPPVPPVSDEDVETLAGLVDEAGLRVVANASSRLIARRLLATGRVSVTQ